MRTRGNEQNDSLRAAVERNRESIDADNNVQEKNKTMRKKQDQTSVAHACTDRRNCCRGDLGMGGE